ncbi:hypothetical protein FN846DRAFT_996352, partial [Sphaerosporella brunnea]
VNNYKYTGLQLRPTTAHELAATARWPRKEISRCATGCHPEASRDKDTVEPNTDRFRCDTIANADHCPHFPRGFRIPATPANAFHRRTTPLSPHWRRPVGPGRRCRTITPKPAHRYTPRKNSNHSNLGDYRTNSPYFKYFQSLCELLPHISNISNRRYKIHPPIERTTEPESPHRPSLAPASEHLPPRKAVTPLCTYTRARPMTIAESIAYRPPNPRIPASSTFSTSSYASLTRSFHRESSSAG